ncbi:MAG: protoporphyrinogen oxidase [Candidatus Solibacter usitatus]|nr:protoporphyrinogen oxidase [Candidatus Solibacter usitatus]
MRTLIIGGGITGLAAAYELVKAGRRSTIIEAQPVLGGVIQTETVEGCVLEGGPDSFLAAKPAAAELIREVGLGDQLIGSKDHERVTYLVKGGRLVPLPDGLLMMVPTRILPVAFSPLLSWSTKMRMGLEYFRKPPAVPLPDRTVEEFITDHYGRETVDYLAEPLLAGVYGGSVARLSVVSVLTRFVEIESKYGSLTRGVLAAKKRAPRGGETAPLFQTLKSGLAALSGELERRIQGQCEVITGRAERVERHAGGYSVRVNGEDVTAEALIMACPAWQAGALLRGVDERLAGLLEGVEYSSSITLALGYRREQCGHIPPGFGFLVPAKERRSLVACTFVGAKFPYRVPDSHVMLRCFLGGAGDEGILDWSDGELLAAVRGELKRLLGWDAEPAFTRIRRWRRSMAQYPVGHAARIRQVREILAGLPGLEVAGNAYEGIGISDCVRTGRAAARAVTAGAPA